MFLPVPTFHSPPSGPTVDERGFGAVLALALALGGVLLVGLATDVARLLAAWQEASHVAHTAAEVGAGWVDPLALYEGSLTIDRTSAQRESRRFLVGAGLEGSVDARSDRVCVSVWSEVEPGLIRFVGAGFQTVAVTACAEPRRG
jgi:hypothetical protein